MRELNGASYEGIDVVTLDGRTYVERSEGGFDVITLLNSHFAKGYVKGRSASPEYLQTVEAFERHLCREALEQFALVYYRAVRQRAVVVGR